MSNIKDMIVKLFPQTPKDNVEILVEYINTYGSAFKVDTPLRIAHFLAQVREELGANFKPVYENLNYSYDGLIRTFKTRFDLNGDKQLDDVELQLIKSVVGYPKQIATIVYAGRLGNGDMKSEDGWNYRGTGALQITGRYNFQEVQKRIDKCLPNSGVNIVTGSKVDSMLGTLLIGFGYWYWKDLYIKADQGSSKEVVDSITAIINKYTDSYSKRASHFAAIKHLI